MKGILHTVIVFSIVIVSVTRLSAQQKHIGLDIALGKYRIGLNGINQLNPFNRDFDNYRRIGLNYYYNPPNAPFNVKTGISFDNRENNMINLNLLRIPIGLDFTIGKKFQFVFGFGFYTGVLLTQKGIGHSDFENSLYRFQLGFHDNFGFGYHISTDFNLNVVYQSNIDITAMYEDKRMSPGGAKYSLYEKGYDGFMKIELKYRLHKK